MGFGFGREVRNVCVSLESKPKEPNCFSSEKQSHFTNHATNESYVNYISNPIEVKTKEKIHISPFRPQETKNPCNAKSYENGGKDFVGLNLVKGSPMGSRKNVSLNLKTQVSSDMGCGKSEGPSNGVCDYQLPTLPPTTRLDSKKRVKHLRSVSFSEEGPNSVIREHELGSNVRTSRKIGSPKSSSPRCPKRCIDDKSKNSHMGTPPRGDSKSKGTLSFGNIYRGPKNIVSERDASLEKLTQANDTRVKGAGLECGGPRPISANHHVLGFGGGNYGHGSVIKGARNAEILTKNNCSTCPTMSKEEKGDIAISLVTPRLESAEELKNAGNDEYKKGCFSEAISFYNKAIGLCPKNAACHNNKAAALAALGRHLEAVGECLEAINCDPSYSRAHYRLGNLYTRLGNVEDAKRHFKLSGEEIGSKATQNLLDLETHLINIRNAQKVEDWGCILTESSRAIEAGADASYQVLAVKAEALFRMHRAEEALELLITARKPEENKWTNTQKGDSSLLIIETQVCMYLGRFDDGVIAAEIAVNLDGSPESLMWLRNARALADARRAGNEFFKSGKYIEACKAYTRGLKLSPINSVLLCNRAACRTKLGQWELAVDDCTAALRNRPNYTKALLRRAHCNAQLEHWEESVRDYMFLSQEMPGDSGIANSLLRMQMEFKRAQGGAYDFQAGGYTKY